MVRLFINSDGFTFAFFMAGKAAEILGQLSGKIKSDFCAITGHTLHEVGKDEAYYVEFETEAEAMAFKLEWLSEVPTRLV